MSKKNIIDNRYAVIKGIGEGGFATVHKAWASNLERFVAIKKINETYSNDAKFLDMFRNEAVNTAKLDHPNIVRVIDFLRTSNNIYYIIMEYANGRDLRYLLQSCRKKNMRIPFGLCMFIVCETLKALRHANGLHDEINHKPLNIVHRDISPGNILLYFDGRVKLTDFGIAKVSSQFGEKTKEGLLRGKVAYMSPEQAGGSIEIDHRSDIYAVGIVLYEMLTGKQLFHGKSDYEVWTMAKKGNINLDLIEKAAHIPPPIKMILKKSLMRDRDERYQTADEMIKDIQRFFGDAYEVQSEGLKDFLSRCMPVEIENEKKEQSVPPPVIDDQIAAETQPKLDAPGDSAAEPGISVPDKSLGTDRKPVRPKPSFHGQNAALHESEKTVFDFVLDTAKKHEKIFIGSIAGILLLGILIVSFDVYKQITPFGTRIHGYLWPPALTIDSFPAGADVALIKDGEQVENGTTPLNIEKLVPGNYTVRIQNDGYHEIERRVTVKGDDVFASGNVYTSGKQKNYFLFPFEVPVKIDSNPPGAEIYIDGKKIPSKTPVYHTLEIGKHTIQIFMNGFEPLGSSDMKPVYGQCWIDFEKSEDQQNGIDRRYWGFSKRMKAGLNEYLVSGTFWKSLNITTDPQSASIYLDEEKNERGKSPLNNEHFKVGKHRIRIEKKGYKSVEKTIDISAETKESLFFPLNKYIWFRSFDVDDPAVDLNAEVTVKELKVKNKKTPFRIAVPLKKYSAQFYKNTRYDPRTVTFNARSTSEVKGSLKLRKPFITYVVKISNTSTLVPNAYILFNDVYQGSTDEKGVWKAFVDAGTVTVKVNTGDRFAEKSFEAQFVMGSRTTEEIYLNPPSNGTLYIDTRPHFIGAQIYVDGIYQNETIRKISKMHGGKHAILIRHYDLEEDIETEINFNKPDQVIKIKISEKGEFVIRGDE